MWVTSAFLEVLPLKEGQRARFRRNLPGGFGVEFQSYLTESVFEVILQKSIPAQIRQPILNIKNSKG